MNNKKKLNKLDDNLDDNLDNLDESLDEEEDIDDYSTDPNESDDNSDDIDIMFKFNTNNHKIEGKHSLKRDIIFKGKIKEESVEEQTYITDEQTPTDGFPIESGSMYEFESKHNDEYVSRIELSNDVYHLLKNNTELDFTSNRRKPNRQAFNDYYQMLLNNLGKKYSKSEIFVELSYYFTDNIFNMFKLLDKEYATQIIFELKQNGYLDNLSNINFV